MKPSGTMTSLYIRIKHLVITLSILSIIFFEIYRQGGRHSCHAPRLNAPMNFHTEFTLSPTLTASISLTAYTISTDYIAAFINISDTFKNKVIS